VVEEEGADFCRGEGKLSAGAVGRSCYFGCCWKKKKTRGQRGVAGLCFFEEETMERKKKKKGGYGAGLSSFNCCCSADDRLGRLVVSGREGAGKRCWFEGRRKCWNRLERERGRGEVA